MESDIFPWNEPFVQEESAAKMICAETIIMWAFPCKEQLRSYKLDMAIPITLEALYKMWRYKCDWLKPGYRLNDDLATSTPCFFWLFVFLISSSQDNLFSAQHNHETKSWKVSEDRSKQKSILLAVNTEDILSYKSFVT